MVKEAYSLNGNTEVELEDIGHITASERDKIGVTGIENGNLRGISDSYSIINGDHGISTNHMNSKDNANHGENDSLKNAGLTLSDVGEEKVDLKHGGHPKRPSKVEEENGQTKTEDISFLKMFRFADKWSKLLLVIGILFSGVTGLAVPTNLIVYGEVATAFIYYGILHSSYSMGGNSTTSLPFNPEEYDDLYGVVRQYGVYFCLIGIGSIVSGYIQHLCWDISQERQMSTIRKNFFKSVIHHDISWFDVQQSGELGTSFSESMHAVASAIGKEFSIFIQYITTCVGAYVLTLYKSWKIALACMAFSPLLIIIGGVLTRWVKNLSARESKAYARAGSVVEEALSSIKTVMAFNGQERESRRYDDALKVGGSSAFGKGLAMGSGMGLIWLILYFVICTAFGYGISLMAQGEPGFEPGNVLITFMGVMIGSMSLAQGLTYLQTLGTGIAAAGKIYQIIDHKPLIDSSSDKGEKPKSISGTLELRDVCFKYPARPEVQVLDNMNVTVEPGKTVALVGYSGCGKSTVVQLIERFYDADSGEVLLDGKNVKDLNVAWLRKQIGLVSQEPVLFSTSIKENIQHGNEDITDEQIRAAAKEANIHDFIALLPEGYNTLVGDRGTQLSGGQKQRIAIARALVRNPKILLLDEATSALDNESEAIVQKALEKAQEGRTTIIIAHRLSTIKNADKILVIEEGNVVEEGTHGDLMKKRGLYHQLVENQMDHDTDEKVVEELEELVGPSRKGLEKKTSLTYKHSKKQLERRTSLTSVKSKVSQIDEEKEIEEILSKFSMKRILRFNAPEWLYIVIGCLSSVVVGAMQPAFAYLISEFLVVFTQPLDEQKAFMWTLIGIIIGIGVANTVMRLALTVCFAIAGFKLTRRMRSLTFKSFLRQDMTFFDDEKNRVGILTTRLASDATLVEGATGLKIGSVLEALAVILSALIVSFIASWKLSFVVLAFMPLMIGMGLAQGKLAIGFSKKDKGALEQAGQICTETVDSIRVVVSLTQENTFKNKYNKLIDEVCSKSSRRSFVMSLVMSVSTSVVFFSYAAAFTYGAFLVHHDGLNFHLVFRVFAAITFGGMHIGRTSVLSPDFSKAKLAAARLFALMDTEPKIDITKKEGKVLEKYDGKVEFQSVSFRYPARRDVTVLNNMSFTVCPGETVALVGSSGCGKSTTISLLERFYDPETGEVLAGDEDIQLLNLKWLRSQIGLVSQEPALFDCSIAENIAYGDNSREVSMEEIIEKARIANIHNFITSLPEGYETNVGNKGTQLSGGQKQRIAIARALVSNPKILLLDEATSALDSKSEKVVQDALDQARKGRTCIVIAHRLSTIQNANKIAIIHKGEVVEQGNHTELLSQKGIYYKLIRQKN